MTIHIMQFFLKLFWKIFLLSVWFEKSSILLFATNKSCCFCVVFVVICAVLFYFIFLVLDLRWWSLKFLQLKFQIWCLSHHCQILVHLRLHLLEWAKVCIYVLYFDMYLNIRGCANHSLTRQMWIRMKLLNSVPLPSIWDQCPPLFNRHLAPRCYASYVLASWSA